ncbi:hypothetical protein JMG10_13225 [Nostoc ellipsosporum NOK]|nr:hypothetical protein [Nostoc ellipsosporum NOK]
MTDLEQQARRFVAGDRVRFKRSGRLGTIIEPLYPSWVDWRPDDYEGPADGAVRTDPSNLELIAFRAAQPGEVERLEAAKRAIALVETPNAPASATDPWDWLYWLPASRERFERLARAALSTPQRPERLDREAVRQRAVEIVQQEARDLGYIEEDVAELADPDGDGLLALQAVERAILALLPSEQIAESANCSPGVPEGMKPWHGGDSTPDDYGGAHQYLTRDGQIYDWIPGNGAGPYWSREDEPGDIIAYTPKPTRSLPSENGWREDRERLRAEFDRIDKAKAECPINNGKQRDSSKPCRKCGNGPDRGCVALDMATSTALTNIRAAISEPQEQGEGR